MKETLIDIETYCEADIKKCGLYRYVSDPSFEILLIAWATDEGEGFGETKLADLASGDPFPKELLDDFKDSNVTLIAHNAAFERVSFSRYLQQHYPGQYLKPGTFLSPNNWICTMVMAASLTLPMALKDVGEVLRTTQQKDEEGKRLIKLFSAPCKPTKSNGGRTRNLPYHLPEDWAKFKYYCIQDVNTEVDIYKRLKRFPMSAREWHHYRVNERINDRGVRIDTELVQQAITCDLLLSDAMTTKAYELTGLENPNSVSQLKTWLDERGISMDTLGKKNVTEMIGELDKNGVDAEAMDKWLVEYYEKNGMRWDFSMVVIDELSSFKNYQSQRFKFLRKVRPYVKRWVGLTGTPSSNGLMDLWAEIGILDGGERLGKFIGRYREAYFKAASMNLKKVALDRETEQKVRFKTTDCWGNTSYLEIRK